MRKNKNINIMLFLFIVLVYPFFKTYYISEIGIMPIVNQVLFAIVLMAIVFFYFSKLPYITIYRGMLFIIIYYILILISTIKSKSLDFDYFSFIAFSIGFALLVNYSLDKKERFLSFLLAIYILLYCYVVINLFVMVIYSNGIPSITNTVELPRYLFGNTNSVIKIILPGLCFSFLYDSLKFKKIRGRSWLLLVLSWITLILTWSLTSLIGLFIFTFVVLNKVGKNQLFVYYISSLITSTILTVILAFSGYRSELLENVLGSFGKSLTFSGRDVLWMNTMESITNYLSFGYGHLSPDKLWEYTGNRFGSHNYYLDTLIRGGIISLLLLFIAVIYYGKKLINYKNNYITRIIVGTCCAYFIMWISEPFYSTEYLMFSIFFVLLPRLNIILGYFEN